MKAFGRLKTIFEGTTYYEKAAPIIAHLQEVVSFAERLGIKTQIFVNPLTCVNASNYRGGIIFACHYDTKQRLIFAGGGRYDSVVRQFRDKDGKIVADRHVVGFGIEWENLTAYMSAHQRKSSSKPFLKKGAEELRGVWAVKKVRIEVFVPFSFWHMY
jgi:translation initiation factor 2-alpha kinase 4